ncbi:MAG TPA: type I-E CRISPR-associated protein Cas5/CasD [Rectinema sp.]|jgi:CRISPR system Cascade subunit CasD|nr:type I-E CRISPR-associated protein Cas5/CasD [Rectinema sp.]
METLFILLWFESPLQSWGYDSKFGRRDTLDFPTKSGVLGLVLCALGASGEQQKLLARFAGLRQTVISFRYGDEKTAEPKLPFLHDFQMIGSGYRENDEWQTLLIPKKSDGSKPVGGGTKLTHRYYLQDAVFAVLLEVPADLVEQIAHALQHPAYDIYLGRKCCVPSEFVYQGSFDTLEATEAAALHKAMKQEGRKLYEEFRVIDGDFEEGDSFTLTDVPVQFGKQKKYHDRRVTKIQKGL